MGKVNNQHRKFMDSKKKLLLVVVVLHWLQISLAQNDVLYEEAIQAFENNEPNIGLEKLNLILENNPLSYDALYARGYYHMSMEDFENALPDYDRLIGIRPEEYDLYLYRGQAFLGLEEYELAENDFFLALELEPADINIYNALGSLYYILGLYQDAQDVFQEGLIYVPEDNFAQFYVAATHYQLGNLEEALSQTELLITQQPQDWDIHRLKANILLAQNRYDAVLELYDNLQKEEIEFIEEDFLIWGKVYYHLERYGQALFFFEIPEEPESLELNHYLAKLHFKLRNWVLVESYLSNAIDLSDPQEEGTSILLYDLAVVKAKRGDFEEATHFLTKAVYLNPEILIASNYWGEELDLLADIGTIIRLEDRQDVLQEAQVSGWKDRAEALLNLGDTSGAMVEIEKALEIAQEDSYLTMLKAVTYSLQEDYESAWANFKLARELTQAQDLEKIYYFQSLTHEAQGNFQDAIICIDQAIGLNTSEAYYYADKAGFYAQEKNFEKAVESVSEAISLEAEELSFYTERSRYYYEMNMFQEAITDANWVLNIDENDAMAYYIRGLSYMEIENYKGAENDFLQLLAIFPEDAELLALYEEANRLTP